MLFTLWDSWSQGEGCKCSGCGWELSLPVPTETPLLGWTEITAENYPKCSSPLPNISSGLLRTPHPSLMEYSSTHKTNTWVLHIDSNALNSSRCPEFVPSYKSSKPATAAFIANPQGHISVQLSWLLVGHQTAKVEGTQCKCVAWYVAVKVCHIF